MKPSEKRHFSMTRQPPKTNTSSTNIQSNSKPSVLVSKDLVKTNAPFVPRYKKPVDVFNQANKIIEKAGSHQVQFQKQKQSIQDSRSSNKVLEHPPQNQPSSSKPHRPDNTHQQIKQMLASYQSRQRQLMQKVDRLQEQIFQAQKQYEKKTATLIKQNKANLKQIQRLNDSIKHQDQQFNKLLADPNIPYNAKREIILQSHIQRLKEYNQELVLRLKSYKGSDREQEANAETKVCVLNEYSKSKGEVDPGMRKLTLESLAYRISKQIEGYLKKKVKKEVTFAEEQKYLVEVQRGLNEFAFECLEAGLSVNHEEVEPNYYDSGDFVKRVENSKSYPVLNETNSRIIKNTCANLSIVSEAKQLCESVEPFLSKLTKPSTIILNCFQSSKKPAEIKQRLQQSLGVNLRMLKNTNYIYLSILIHCLGKYDILKNYLHNLILDIRKSVKSVSSPLSDLQSLYQYKDKNQSVFKQKIASFVVNNIDGLRLRVGELQKELQQIPIKFSKFINYI